MNDHYIWSCPLDAADLFVYQMYTWSYVVLVWLVEKWIDLETVSWLTDL